MKFDDFKGAISVPGGEIKWKLFHDIHEKDALLEANLRKSPKLTTQVLHPGSYKQNAPKALEIFPEATASAFQTFKMKSTVVFLKLFSKL